MEFSNQSQKTRYFRVLKELQIIKSKMLANPTNKFEIINGFIMLHTRYTPSEEETSKFIKFLVTHKTAPTNLNLKDTIFYMLTFDKNFDLADRDEYGLAINKDLSSVSNLLAGRCQSKLEDKSMRLSGLGDVTKNYTHRGHE